MRKTHYEVLGVSAKSTTGEIRSAYRKLVMVHHPDHSSTAESKSLFLRATEAYEVLSDGDQRREYDARLVVDGRQKAAGGTPSARMAEMKLDLNRLSLLYARGNFVEAKILANRILERDRRQAIPYAVLGDMAMMAGNRREALRLYGSAVQFDARNPIYRRRYEELSASPRPVRTAAPVQRPSDLESHQATIVAPIFGLGLIALACAYVMFSREMPVMPQVKLISTWTLGLIVMMFISGAVLASCLALDGLLTTPHPNRRGVSPATALATIAAVNFWVALVMYAVIAMIRRSFSRTTSRLLAGTVAATCLLAFAAEASGNVAGIQVFLWGGNIVYLGAICGWIVTDAVRMADQ